MSADNSLPAVTLVLGGARSGKSALAERLVEASGQPCLYFATAEAGDAEMVERIRQHQERRGAQWATQEEPLELAAGLLDLNQRDCVILVDCLTLWLANLLYRGADPEIATENLVDTLPKLTNRVVFVSNEVGMGIVPENPLARQFRDLAGRLNQRLAAASQAVVFTAAGLPLVLKAPGAFNLPAAMI